MSNLRPSTPSARRPALALLVTLGLTLAWVAPTHAQPRQGMAGGGHHRKVPLGFLGVVGDGPLLDGTTPLASQTPRMAAAGLETLGIALNWSDVQPFASVQETPPAARPYYPPRDGIPTSFAVTDAAVLAAARAGMGVYPVVIHAPAWARLDPSKDFSPPADPEAYGRLLTLLIGRYGPHGTLWAEHPELRARPIRAWQVWNEPAGGLKPDDPSVFWDAPPPFQPRYTALLHAAHDAIRSADPGAQVVLAGLVGRSWETLQTLYDSGAGRYFDAVALHPYTGLAHNVIVIPRRVRAVMRRNGDAAKPIIISELGWPSFDGRSVARLPERQREQAQADWLKHALGTLVASRAAVGIHQILIYSWVTHDTSPTYAFDYSGLERVLANRHVIPKQALAVIAMIAHRLEGAAR